MEIVWERGELTVKKALFYYDRKPLPAYTTVMTVVARLARKGTLKRSKSGGSYVYKPVSGREQFLKYKIQEVKNCLARNFK